MHRNTRKRHGDAVVWLPIISECVGTVITSNPITRSTLSPSSYKPADDRAATLDTYQLVYLRRRGLWRKSPATCVVVLCTLSIGASTFTGWGTNIHKVASLQLALALPASPHTGPCPHAVVAPRVCLFREFFGAEIKDCRKLERSFSLIVLVGGGRRETSDGKNDRT
ncbi:hypothetical protein BDW02DRAFT_63641 [Decorospora gaudefroyi]|uniref:Uncharacterized protein n=1 Tax=Decorospora gaudefroyi TaxID=184978 RepID=A0A6A5K4C7_9PLEO|nr:hypothetical protein BDW02DRAFT_63641 [Decorospora gaudefroyi]